MQPDILGCAEPYYSLSTAWETLASAEGLQGLGAGPEPTASGFMAGGTPAGRQRRIFTSRFGTPALLPDNLNPIQHVAAAAALPHPFADTPVVAADLEFAIQCEVRDESIIEWRMRQLQRLRSLECQCRPVDQRIRADMDPSVLQCVGNMNIAFLAAVVSLLQWPDWALADGFAAGFTIAGVVNPSNVFRPAQPAPPFGGVNELLADADTWNTDIAEDCRPMRDEEEIWRLSEVDRAKGRFWTNKYYSKRELDKIFGRGRWRAIRRFVIWQREKSRQIDDCKASDHNQWAFIREMIHTVPFDIMAAILQCAVRVFGLQVEDDDVQPSVGSEDLPDAYQHCPVLPQHRAVNVVAVRRPARGGQRASVVFAVVLVHLFGGVPSVANFNRLPEFIVAAGRRFLALILWHYFDDFGVMSLRASTAGQGNAQECLRELLSLFGRPAAPHKSCALGLQNVHLGVVNNLSHFKDGSVSFPPKAGRIEDIANRMQLVVSDAYPSSGQAASLRGEAGFLESSSYGRIARGLLQRLKLYQYRGGGALDAFTALQLALFIQLLPHLRPRLVLLGEPATRPLLLWTDAAWEKRVASAGALLFEPEARAFTAAACLDWREAVERMSPKEQPIALLEAAALIAAVSLWSQQLRGKHIIVFIDNLSAACALVKGSSTDNDLQHLATAWQLLCAELNMAAWVEWVPSDSNPADQLSREALSPFVAEVEHSPVPDWLVPSQGPAALYRRLIERQ